MSYRLAVWACLGLLSFGWSEKSAAQVTVCGSATGTTPYAIDSRCLPKLTFHVTGQCLSACGEVTVTFTSPSVTANGYCNLLETCIPSFLAQGVFDIGARRFYSLSAHKTVFCTDGPQVMATSPCPCVGCSNGGGPLNNNTPAEDPLLISTGNTVYQLTSFVQGVKFDFNGDGELEKTAWTAAGSDDAFLALDRNFNGVIDNGLEIFGDQTAQVPSPEPNGFRALAVFDDPMSGGNADGKIDSADLIWPWLLLWTDRNHDGRSTSNEVQSIEGVVTAIHLNYQRSASRDEFGNELRYWATIVRPASNEGAIVAWNVFFANRRPAGKQ